MNDEIPKYVTQARASFLLGISESELGRISKESGLGYVERADDGAVVRHVEPGRGLGLKFTAVSDADRPHFIALLNRLRTLSR